jgi:RHS repeat-associated protein
MKKTVKPPTALSNWRGRRSHRRSSATRGGGRYTLLSKSTCASLISIASFVALGQPEATIYVHKQYELRDHDAPTKYVFNGDTRIAHVTGSLAIRTRLQRLRLYGGWNLCSLAVTAPSSQISNSKSQIPAAYEWNLATTNWLSITPNETLPAGTVLWLKSSTNSTLTLTGPYPEPTNINITARNHFIPSAGLEAWPITNISAVSGPIWKYYSSTAAWLTRSIPAIPDVSSLPEFVAPGEAAYVESALPAQLPIPDPPLRVRYYHQDHLGSPACISTSDADVVDETTYYAFGQPRNSFTPKMIPESYQFTQKELDSESALYYFESRFLAAPLGRFTRVDTLSAENKVDMLRQPQRHNAYGYAANNPIYYRDPQGKDVIIVVGARHVDPQTNRGDPKDAKRLLAEAKTLKKELEKAGIKATIVDMNDTGKGTPGQKISKAAQKINDAGREVTGIAFIGHTGIGPDDKTAMRLEQEVMAEPKNTIESLIRSSKLAPGGAVVGLGCTFAPGDEASQIKGETGANVFGFGDLIGHGVREA